MTVPIGTARVVNIGAIGGDELTLRITTVVYSGANLEADNHHIPRRRNCVCPRNAM